MFVSRHYLFRLSGKVSGDLHCLCKATCTTQSLWEELPQKITLLPKMLLPNWLGWDGNLACDLSLLLPMHLLLPEEHQLGLLQDRAAAYNRNERDG